MDIFDIITPGDDAGRRDAAALKEMGLRAVIAPDGLHLFSEPVGPTPARADLITDRVDLTDQPCDELGEPVDYSVLSIELINDFMDIETAYWFEV
ncbi:MAG: hypothetical protein CMJ44_13690 [Pimelobacter sp.]|nr:hypothetical protein [Pimelobacter sp.]